MSDKYQLIVSYNFYGLAVLGPTCGAQERTATIADFRVFSQGAGENSPMEIIEDPSWAAGTFLNDGRRSL
jgi:hypothetical protein